MSTTIKDPKNSERFRNPGDSQRDLQMIQGSNNSVVAQKHKKRRLQNTDASEETRKGQIKVYDYKSIDNIAMSIIQQTHRDLQGSRSLVYNESRGIRKNIDYKESR